ncbi:CMRF35-like molecule 8 isoform X4 [Hemibagrus wyckioides]|uniref:CMRF35-like molecule 8 isoform X4 n=1 Tax=Hemibagrus wyckioides TaxID=337641 RepID=UPI00266D214F|nr:CMRF35-like molecule 8 isoform X4 [Hemibagrus wyckioides]
MYSYITHCELGKKAGSVQKTMQTFLWTLSFIQVLISVTESKAESVFNGTEGGSVNISCEYPDGYQKNTMYVCHDPCTYSDVLIKSEKVDQVVSKGRYTALNTPSEQSFSVTIRNLTLNDGVYYCGVEKWFMDILIEVKLTVTKVVLQCQSPDVTQLPCATTLISCTADNFTSVEQASSTTQPQHSLDPHKRNPAHKTHR